MGRFTLTFAILLSLAGPTVSQDLSFPTLTFPQPGTFCGALQPCTPLVTQDGSG